MTTEEWKEIDWAKVGKEKAIFLYQEAKETEHEVVAAINALNQKAFNLLTLTFPFLIALISALLSQWTVIDTAVRLAGLVMSGGLFLSAGSMFAALFPRQIFYVSASPDQYFAHDYYKGTMIEILHGNLRGAVRDITYNEKVLRHRGIFFRIGFALLMAVTPLAVLTFFILST